MITNIEEKLAENNPAKKGQINEAIQNAIDMLSSEIEEIAQNYLDMWDDD
ncbi:MAG: hypothetical protein FWE27_02650 [Defluviitaleaceae bacterium]|nr:hypothetical protein [Defluviitaleaceae bacterium]